MYALFINVYKLAKCLFKVKYLVLKHNIQSNTINIKICHTHHTHIHQNSESLQIVIKIKSNVACS